MRFLVAFLMILVRWALFLFYLLCLASSTRHGTGQADPGAPLKTQTDRLMASNADTQSTLDLGVIGNCRTAALLDTGGRIVWWCFPRFDSDPVFSRLLAGQEEKGFCDVQLEGVVAREAAYIRNTALIRTIMRDAAGNAVAITDFVPRFKRFERVFNPPQIFRRIEPAAGLPRIKIRMRPTFNYGQAYASRALGSNHIRF